MNDDLSNLTDDQLEAVLAEVLSGVTQKRRDGAVAAYSWRSVDAELAELLSDSRTDDRELVLRDGVNGADGYQLRFAIGDGQLTIDVDATGAETVDLVLQAELATPFDGWAMRTSDGEEQTLPAGVDRAVIPGTASDATFRIELQRSGKVVVVTEWISL